jgi:hypothetical protein
MTEVDDDVAPEESDGTDAVPPPGPVRRDLRRRVVLLLCVAAVLGVYYRCATSYGKSLDPAPRRNDFQNVQAYAFVHGQLNVLIEVPPGLEALPDPTTPRTNHGTRLHDLVKDGKLNLTARHPSSCFTSHTGCCSLLAFANPACLIFARPVSGISAFQHTARLSSRLTSRATRGGRAGPVMMAGSFLQWPLYEA